MTDEPKLYKWMKDGFPPVKTPEFFSSENVLELLRMHSTLKFQNNVMYIYILKRAVDTGGDIVHELLSIVHNRTVTWEDSKKLLKEWLQSSKKIGCTVEHKYTGTYSICTKGMLSDNDYLFVSNKKVKY